jgi:hypothetical protein
MIDSWLVPGLVLAIGFGLGSLVTAYGILSRPARPQPGAVEERTRMHWSSAATVLLGAAQIGWLAVEWVYVGASPLLVLYGAVAVTLVTLPLRERRREHAWT